MEMSLAWVFKSGQSLCKGLPAVSAAAAAARLSGATNTPKKAFQSPPPGWFSCSTQITGTPRRRSSAARRLIGATMPRAAGTSTGAPGATKAFCMSITSSAVRFGSRASNTCSLPRRAMTRSMISWRSSERIEIVGHLDSLICTWKNTQPCAEVVAHVVGAAGARDGAGDRRVRHDPLEEVLRPARDAELGGPGRQRLAFDPSEQRALGKRPVDDDGNVHVLCDR